MRRCLAALLFGLLAAASSGCAPRTEELRTRLLQAEAKLLYSLSELRRLNEQVASLEAALLEARQSAENSGEKISVLEALLSEAQKSQEVFARAVETWKRQSEKLSKSLEASEAMVSEQGKGLEALQGQLQRAARAGRRKNLLILGLLSLAVVEAVIIIVD